MAMTYEESATLMADMQFQGRVKVACLSYAGAIFIEPPTAPAHNARTRWATTCYANPAVTAAQVTPPTVMNVNVQQAGPNITDAALQAAVQYTVDFMI